MLRPVRPLPLPANSWCVLTSALPTRTTHYHTDAEQARLPEALPSGTLVRVVETRHKHARGRDEHGYSQTLVPVIGVVPFGNPNGRDDGLRLDHARTAWFRWCDDPATVAHQKRWDEPTPVLATDRKPPVRPATAEDVQPLFDQVVAARQRAMAANDYSDLRHYNQDVESVLSGLSHAERQRLVEPQGSTPEHRWRSSGLDQWRFAVQHAALHDHDSWVWSQPSTPRSRAGLVLPLNVADDAGALLNAHTMTMRWIDRIGAGNVTDWMDEALATLVSDRAAVGRVRQAEHGLQRLPSLDKPVWSLAEQEARNRLVERTVNELEGWWDAHVRSCLDAGDERLIDATTLHRADEPASSGWNREHFRSLQREVLPLVVEELLWQRKVDLDLQARQKQELHAVMGEVSPQADRPARPVV